MTSMNVPDNEIHHVQFTDPNDQLQSSITILIQHQTDRGPISADDVLDVHEELQTFSGSINPFLN